MTLKLAAALTLAGGLVLTVLGAWFAARGVIITEADATSLAATKWDLNEALKANLLSQSALAYKGLGLVAAGSVLQLVGTVLQYFQD